MQASLQRYDEALTDAEKVGSHVAMHLTPGILPACQPYAVGTELHASVQVVELKPEWPKGYSRLGAAAIGLGDTAKAKGAYEKGAHPQPTAASAS